MAKGKKIFSEWTTYLINQYNEFINNSKKYRCKIVSMEIDSKAQQAYLFVMICGVKNQIVKYYPAELVANDVMLFEFSQTDVRAITFYALKNAGNQSHNKINPSHIITAQEFSNGNTIFIFKKLGEEGEFRKSSYELYSSQDLLEQFSFNDLMTIITTAIQEQTFEDIERIYN